MAHRTDLTCGPIAKGVALFVLPLLGTSIIQQLYPTVDLLFVGNVLGTHSTAALGIGMLLLTCLIGLFSGISVGANVRVANLMGAGDGEGVSRACHTSLALGVVGGLLLVVLGEVLVEPFIDVMEVPAEAVGDAVTYMRFAVAASLPIALYNTCAGALRGLGDSRSPFWAQLIGGIFNIAANWLALCVFGWGIAGCAFATFASNGLAAAIASALLVRCEPRSGGVDWDYIRFVLRFGLPIAVQTVAITLSNVVVQHQMDLLGVEAVAAFAIYLKVELPVYYPILAMGQTATTFVAQNDGAGAAERCRQGEKMIQVMCLLLAAVLSVLMIAAGPLAFGIFGSTDEVVSLGVTMMGVAFPLYFIYAVLEVQADVMRGYGNSFVPAVVVLFNICVLRTILVLALGIDGTDVVEIAAAYPITWFTTAVSMVVFRKVLGIGAKQAA